MAQGTYALNLFSYHSVQVYRDKEGKAVSREELEAARKAELEKKAKERETPEWAAGLRQQREAADRRAAMAAEAAKPFARSKCASDQQGRLLVPSVSWPYDCSGVDRAMLLTSSEYICRALRPMCTSC